MDLIEGEMINPIKHWYYAHKYKAIMRAISEDLFTAKTIVDVGAGSALFSLEILKSHKNLNCLAIDTSYELPLRMDQENRITYLRNGHLAMGEIYLFTDVLEHVQNDVGFLATYVSAAPMESRFVITVPAFMSLWSGHDIFLKHCRRYRIDEIENCVISSGLSVQTSQYLYAPLFPIAWIMRRMPQSKEIKTQMTDHGRFLNSLALIILKFDFILSQILPFGISIIVSAEKLEN